MESLRVFRSSISREVNQKETLQKNLILKVLSSKRLLVDHVEIIEESLNDLMKQDRSEKDFITLLMTSGVLATSYVLFIHLRQKYLIPSVCGVMPIMYIQKLVNTKRRETVEAKLSKFSTALDNYESAIKKNKTFLQEAQVVKSFGSILKRYDKDNKIPINLIESIRNVINALYRLVKLLETFAITDKMSLVYEPFEDLEQCELMTSSVEAELDVKVIKDYFNIFAYVQSQVLMRFALITITSVDVSKRILETKIDEFTEIVVKETSNISKFLEIIERVSQLQLNIQKQIDEEIAMTMPKELREVRSGTIKFSAKILTVAIQCQHLEELIVKFAGNYESQNKKDVAEIMANMKTVENEMSINVEELRRIAISFQKYLNIKADGDKIPQEKLDDAAEHSAKPLRVISGDEFEPQQDDFFFVDGNDHEPNEKENLRSGEANEESHSKLMAKKYFKPVLKQLKERIDVIDKNMKVREKKVLKAKGIEIDDEPEVAQLAGSNDDGDSGSDDERERERKLKRNQEKFSDNREFLEAKQPINIFAGGFPLTFKGQALDEDVLE